DLGLEVVDRRHQGEDLLDLPLVVVAEDLGDQPVGIEHGSLAGSSKRGVDGRAARHRINAKSSRKIPPAREVSTPLLAAAAPRRASRTPGPACRSTPAWRR